jgi:hypothetical protein
MANKTKPKNKSNQQQHKQGAKPVSKGPAHKKPVHKERGFWLTAALVVMVLTGIVAAIFYYAAKTPPDVNRTWILTAMVVANLLDVIAAVGIWFWKKWGLYVYVAATIIALIAGLVTVGMWASFYLVLPAVIVGWLLRTKWSYFDIT